MGDVAYLHKRGIIIPMINKTKLKPKEIAIVKLKAQGKTAKQIAEVVYPNQTANAGKVSVNRLLSNATVQQTLKHELEKQGITIEEAIKPIKEALIANKVDRDEDGLYISSVPDHAVRLKASDMSLGLLGVKQQTEGSQSIQAPISSPEFIKALKDNDTITLNQIIFNKD